MKLYDDDGTFIGDLVRLREVDGQDARYVLTVPRALSAEQKDRIGSAWRNFCPDAKLLALEEGMTLKDDRCNESPTSA